MSKCPPYLKCVSVLFAMTDSIYKTLPGCDVWDEQRNALNFKGGAPIIAHPPCRLFSRMRYLSKADIEEKRLAYFAIDMVRNCGGVLEHPYQSKLWEEKKLPKPGQRDRWGFTIAMPQFWFGHMITKPTLFYICGLGSSKNLPEIEFKLGDAGTVFERMPKHLRSATPPRMAQWLLAVARKTKPYENQNQT